jgi:hypothetical protein
MRDVEYADSAPDALVLLDYSRILHRHIETGEGDHLATQLYVPVVEGRLLDLTRVDLPTSLAAASGP